MLPDTITRQQPGAVRVSEPRLSRRFSHRTPHAQCRVPGCPFTRNGPAELLEAAVRAHVDETGHRAEIIKSSSAIYEPGRAA